MTPKEKAIELCKKSASILGYYEYHISDDVKDVALFCVDEILKARTVGNTKVILDKEYWEEVKQEILKL
jgi:hypothetical protein